MTDYIEKLTKAFKNPQELTEWGCEESAITLQIQTCEEISPHKPYCIIKAIYSLAVVPAIL